MPPRQPRPGPVARMLQPRRCTPTWPAARTPWRCAPTTATRTSTRPRRATPGPSDQVLGEPDRRARQLRHGEHHADGRWPTAGSTRSTRSRTTCSRRSSASARARPAIRPPCRRNRSSGRTPAPSSASRCPPTRRTACWSRPRCGCTTAHPPKGARWRPCRSPAPGRRARSPGSTNPRPLPGVTPVQTAAVSTDGYQEWDVLAHVQGMIEAGVSHGWVIRDANENDPDGGDQAFLSREMPQDPPDQTLPMLVLRYEATGHASPRRRPCRADTAPTTVALRPGAHGEHAGGERPGQAASAKVSSSAPRTSWSTSTATPSPAATSARNVSGEEDGLLGRHPQQRPHQRRHPQRHGARVRLRRAAGTGGTTRNVVDDMTLTAQRHRRVSQLFDADDGRTGNTVQQQHDSIDNGETGLSLVSDSENSHRPRQHLHQQSGAAISSSSPPRPPHREATTIQRRRPQPAAGQRWRHRAGVRISAKRILRRQHDARHRRRRRHHPPRVARQPRRRHHACTATATPA